MGSVNRVILVGHIGRDPEIRSAQSGLRIANLSLATSENWRSKDGERKSKTEWHRVSVMNDKLVEIIEKYVRKGSQVYVEGQLQTRKWTDKEGAERYTTEIVLGKFNGQLTLLDSKPSGSGDDDEPAPRQQQRQPAMQDLDDEIPY